MESRKEVVDFRGPTPNLRMVRQVRGTPHLFIRVVSLTLDELIETQSDLLMEHYPRARHKHPRYIPAHPRTSPNFTPSPPYPPPGLNLRFHRIILVLVRVLVRVYSTSTVHVERDTSSTTEP